MWLLRSLSLKQPPSRRLIISFIFFYPLILSAMLGAFHNFFYESIDQKISPDEYLFCLVAPVLIAAWQLPIKPISKRILYLAAFSIPYVIFMLLLMMGVEMMFACEFGHFCQIP